MTKAEKITAITKFLSYHSLYVDDVNIRLYDIDGFELVLPRDTNLYFVGYQASILTQWYSDSYRFILNDSEEQINVPEEELPLLLQACKVV